MEHAILQDAEYRHISRKNERYDSPLEAIITSPELTEEEFGIHFKRYQAGDSRAGNRIVRSFGRSAKILACKYQGRLNWKELVPEALLGIHEALRRFDPARGNKFFTYAQWWMQAYILAAVHDGRKGLPFALSIRPQRLFSHFSQQEVRFHQVHGRIAHDDDELLEFILRSTRIGIGKKESKPAVRRETLRRWLKLYRHGFQIAQSLSAPVGTHGRILEAQLPASEINPEHLLDDLRHQQKTGYSVPETYLRGILKAVARLFPRDGEILIKRFGLNGKEPRSLKDVGNDFGVCRERVRQLEARGITRLQRILEISERKQLVKILDAAGELAQALYAPPLTPESSP
jgi:RNA polymerase primary sigma factor